MVKSFFNSDDAKKPPVTKLETPAEINKWLGQLTPPEGSSLASLIGGMRGDVFSSFNAGMNNDDYRDKLLDARMKCHVLKDKILNTEIDSKLQTDDRAIAVMQRKQSIEVLTKLINAIEKQPLLRSGYLPPLVALTTKEEATPPKPKV